MAHPGGGAAALALMAAEGMTSNQHGPADTSGEAICQLLQEDMATVLDMLHRLPWTAGSRQCHVIGRCSGKPVP